MSKNQLHILYAVLAIMGVFWIHDLWMESVSIDTLPYSEFKKLLKENKIKEISISANQIQGEYISPQNGKDRFMTTRVDDELAAMLDKYPVKYSQKKENTFLPTLLSWFVPVLLFMGVWFFLIRRMAGRAGPGAGLMSIGKSKAKVYMEKDTQTRFQDVAGVDEAKGELEEIVSFLKDPKSYGRLGARMPKGILLVGPPGTGKTLLARAVAGEAGVAFFSISGSEFVEMFVGVGAARVRDLFEQARQKAPCIIFIDELDALGRARHAGPFTGGNDEKEQTLNQLLVELDGFDSTTGLVLLAATNRPEILDPALLRAGRFDRQVLVDRPDKLGRSAILRVHARKVDLKDGTNLDMVAALTPGFTGADLANLVNEAALMATRRGAERVGMEDFTSAIERIIAGLEKKNRLLNDRERKIVAYHEMGHTLVASSLKGCDPVHKVSIIPRGIGSLGYTIQRPTDDRFLMTKEELENKMAVLLGGRVAETIIFEHLSTGASDDLAKVTDIARSMVTRYGMVPQVGHVTYDREPSGFMGMHPGYSTQKDYSEKTSREIDQAVRAIVETSYQKAHQVLAANIEVLKEGALLLLEKETLGEESIRKLVSKLAKESTWS